MQFSDVVADATQLVQEFSDSTQGQWVVIIWWATTTGKTRLSVELAQQIPLSVISADSRQLFQWMDIATDKISREIYDQIPHYLLDIISPDEHFTAGQWYDEAKKCIDHIHQEWKRLPCVVGWTWLYLDMLYKQFQLPSIEPDYERRDALYEQEKRTPWSLHRYLQTFDEISAKQIHPHSLRSLVRAIEIYEHTGIPKSKAVSEWAVPYPLLMIGLRRDTEQTNQMIFERIGAMIDGWLIEETKWLLDAGYSPTLQSMQWIGYKETFQYLAEWGDITTRAQLHDAIAFATRRLAKRQRTRFRRYMRDAATHPKDNVQYKVYDVE